MALLVSKFLMIYCIRAVRNEASRVDLPTIHVR